MKKGIILFTGIFSYFIGVAGDDYNIIDFGAVSDGKTINTVSIQQAIDKCSANGGGQVIIPNGDFKTGTIYLKNNVVLYLSPAAVLSGSTAKEDFSKNENALIVANGQHNIGVYGRGTINGNGDAAVWYSKDFGNGLPGRPNVFHIFNCVHVKLKEFTLRNGTRWNIHLINTDLVTVDDIRVISRVVANNDGIDLTDCHNVTISNSYFDCGDDAICPKSETSRSVKNLTITNCIIKSESNGIKFGTKSVGGFRDVTITNCVIYDTRLSGIAIEMVDGGMIDRIVINNVTMQKVNGSLFIKLGKRAGKTPGILRNVFISNLIADSIGCWKPDTTASYFKIPNNPRIGVVIVGQPGYLLENIRISQSSFQFAGGGDAADSKVVMEDKPEGYPEYTNFGVTPAYGLNIRHANNVMLQDVQLSTLQPDARPAIFLEDVQDVTIADLKTIASAQAKAFMRFRSAAAVFIHNCKPAPVPIPFLSLEENIRDFSILNNDLRRVAGPYVWDSKVDKGEIHAKNNIR